MKNDAVPRCLKETAVNVPNIDLVLEAFTLHYGHVLPKATKMELRLTCKKLRGLVGESMTQLTLQAHDLNALVRSPLREFCRNVTVKDGPMNKHQVQCLIDADMVNLRYLDLAMYRTYSGIDHDGWKLIGDHNWPQLKVLKLRLPEPRDGKVYPMATLNTELLSGLEELYLCCRNNFEASPYNMDGLLRNMATYGQLHTLTLDFCDSAIMSEAALRAAMPSLSQKLRHFRLSALKMVPSSIAGVSMPADRGVTGKILAGKDLMWPQLESLEIDGVDAHTMRAIAPCPWLRRLDKLKLISHMTFEGGDWADYEEFPISFASILSALRHSSLQELQLIMPCAAIMELRNAKLSNLKFLRCDVSFALLAGSLEFDLDHLLPSNVFSCIVQADLPELRTLSYLFLNEAIDAADVGGYMPMESGMLGIPQSFGQATVFPRLERFECVANWVEIASIETLARRLPTLKVLNLTCPAYKTCAGSQEQGKATYDTLWQVDQGQMMDLRWLRLHLGHREDLVGLGVMKESLAELLHAAHLMPHLEELYLDGRFTEETADMIFEARERGLLPLLKVLGTAVLDGKSFFPFFPNESLAQEADAAAKRLRSKFGETLELINIKSDYTRDYWGHISVELSR